MLSLFILSSICLFIYLFVRATYVEASYSEYIFSLVFSYRVIPSGETTPVSWNRHLRYLLCRDDAEIAWGKKVFFQISQYPSKRQCCKLTRLHDGYVPLNRDVFDFVSAVLNTTSHTLSRSHETSFYMDYGKSMLNLAVRAMTVTVDRAGGCMHEGAIFMYMYLHHRVLVCGFGPYEPKPHDPV